MSILIKDKLIDDYYKLVGNSCKLMSKLDNNNIIIFILVLKISLQISKIAVDYQIIFFIKA